MPRHPLMPQAKRTVLRSFTYGVHVATVIAEPAYAASTITWISQASFSPPLLMVGIKVGSRLHGGLERCGAFAVNVVGEGQQDIASAFLRPTQVDGDKLNGYEFELGPQTGAPLLVDLPMWLEVLVRDSVRGGDHAIVVAEIIGCGIRNESARSLPLRATGWSYGG